MHVYRLTGGTHADDLSGQGAWLYGGRWNNAGTRMIYTGSTLSLCACEVFVHLDKDEIPDNMVAVTYEIPDREYYPESSIEPDDSSTAMYGDQWVESGSSLTLHVKSIVIRSEYNILINPAHPDVSSVRIVDISPFSFDNRFFS